MLLAQNGRVSSSKLTRHIALRYYFVTERVKAKEVSIECCPTEEMNADFFTKPLASYRECCSRNSEIGS
jgi:hypothetical protein